ncbi:MAG TPA: outer membrane beta-barrel protein [Stellaceae bacterium]|nr:outer membrane beta-barrel protein [Stellaceae bacterium]
MTVPAMAGPLAANPHPVSFDGGPLGNIYVTGAVSGLGLLQSEPFPSDHQSRADLSNGLVSVQNTAGLVQFFAQAGLYSFPALGAPYLQSWKATGEFFGPVPVAYAKLMPSDAFSVEVGKLPTLFGAEYGFTFQNMNVERGLLWNQEPIVSRGIQANYTTGPLAFSASLNDGFYSDSYNWLSGTVTWTINKENTLALAGGGNFGQTGKNALPKSPYFYNNSDIVNLIYTYNRAPWTVTPYFQYTHVPGNALLGAPHDNSTIGAAILASYALSDRVSLAGRAEYIAATGDALSPNLLYGPDSSAMSLTLTPTWQNGIWFVRGDLSFVQAFGATAGSAFGRDGAGTTQGRAVIEAGILF